MPIHVRVSYNLVYPGRVTVSFTVSLFLVQSHVYLGIEFSPLSLVDLGPRMADATSPGCQTTGGIHHARAAGAAGVAAVVGASGAGGAEVVSPLASPASNSLCNGWVHAALIETAGGAPYAEQVAY